MRHAVFIPTLDEPPDQVVRTVLAATTAIRNLTGEDPDVHVFDAGMRKVLDLVTLRSHLEGLGVDVELFGVSGSSRPNKNLGIAIILSRSSSERILCLDADIIVDSGGRSLDEVSIAHEGKDDFVLPAVNMSLGRINALVGRPLLRATERCQAAGLPMPFPGVYSLSAMVAKSAVSTPQYRYHFGGELSLILAGERMGVVFRAPATALRGTRNRSSRYKEFSARQIIESAYLEGLIFRTSVPHSGRMRTESDLRDLLSCYSATPTDSLERRLVSDLVIRSVGQLFASKVPPRRVAAAGLSDRRALLGAMERAEGIAQEFFSEAHRGSWDVTATLMPGYSLEGKLGQVVDIGAASLSDLEDYVTKNRLAR